MGTNFYFIPNRCQHCGRGDERIHIGKRSAAGPYCWDCGITLCQGGESAVHMDTHGWYERCPKCLKAPEKESLGMSAAGRELGFNKGEPRPKTGIKSASSFTWAMDPERYVAASSDWLIKDEYGRTYTAKEFDGVLQECPIRFTDSIGLEFS